MKISWIMIDSTYGFSYRNYLYFQKKQRLWEFFLILSSIVTLAVSVGPLYLKLISGLFRQYEMLGIKNLFLANSVTLAGLFGLFTGIFLTINSLFFSKNVEVLFPLPVKAKEVVFGKISEVLIFQILASVILLLPFEIYYGVKSQANLLYWINSILVFSMSQIFPISLIMIIILPLSRILKFKKNRDFMILLAGIVVLILSLLFVNYTNRLAFEGYTEEQFLKLLSNPDGFLSKFTTIYFPAFLATKALVSSGIKGFSWILLYVGFNIGTFYLTIFLGEKFYYQTYLELQEFYAKKEKIKPDELKKGLRVSSLKKALIVREWRYFLKVPSFAFNGLASVVIFPVLLIMFAGFKNSPEFTQIMIFLESYRDFIVPFGILLSTLAASMSTLASSAFSREGKLLNELKMLPVSVKLITQTKFIHVNSVSVMGILSSIIALYILMKINLFESLLIFFGAFACTNFLNMVQMIIDGIRPVLDWDNPQRAMKQNLNVALSIPIVFGFTGGVGYLVYLSKEILSPAIWALLLILIGFFSSVYLWRILLKVVRNLFERDL